MLYSDPSKDIQTLSQSSNNFALWMSEKNIRLEPENEEGKDCDFPDVQIADREHDEPWKIALTKNANKEQLALCVHNLEKPLSLI